MRSIAVGHSVPWLVVCAGLAACGPAKAPETAPATVGASPALAPNGKTGPDRQQHIEGVTPEPLAGQMLRLDVNDVRLQSVAKQ